MTTMTTHCNTEIFADFADRHFGAIDRLTATPLSGGLDCCGIYRVDVVLSAKPRGAPAVFVAKHLRGPGVRELDVYRALRTSRISSAAPRLLGMRCQGRGDGYIFLECIRAIRRWPWVDLDATSQVLHRLAALHSVHIDKALAVFRDREFEREIAVSAVETAAFYHRSALAKPAAENRPLHKAIERVAAR